MPNKVLDDQLKGNHLLLNLVWVSDIETEIEIGGGGREIKD